MSNKYLAIIVVTLLFTNSCYDAIALTPGLDKPRTIPSSFEGIGDWNIEIDDSKNVILSLKAISGKSSWGDPIVLFCRCQSNKTEVFIVWNDYLGSEALVLASVDSQMAIPQRWYLSTDKKVSFYPGDEIPFIKDLIKAERLMVQVTPYDGSPITAEFDLSGLENAVEPLREMCGW